MESHEKTGQCKPGKKKNRHTLKPNSVAIRLTSTRIFSVNKEHKRIIKTE